MIVLGGSQHHRGGLEAFCARVALAIDRHAEGWHATWWPTNTAYLTAGRIGAAARAWRRLGRADPGTVDLVWLQWSTMWDLLFLWRAKALGLPVLVTPHLGANSRLQRVPVLRRLCARLLGRADRIGLLFAGQELEIDLPAGVPRMEVGTFLPEIVLSSPVPARGGGALQILHAGRLSHGKGTFRMVALCAALRARGTPFNARIIGSADAGTVAALTAAIAQAGLDDVLTLTGWMDEDMLVAALGTADVLVHLSVLDSFPLIVLEALAAGAVPIVAEMAGARAMVERYGGLVCPKDDVGAAAAWLAAQDLDELRANAAAVAGRVRRDQAWEQGVGRVVAAAELQAGRNA